MDEQREVESAIEAILFASGDPVGVERICLALDMDRISVDGACRRLADRYRFERRGMRLLQLGTSYQLCSAPEHAAAVRRALESRRPARLSQTALEVLAVIAYFQPITRAYIDQIRGVDSAYTVSMLVDRGLVEECGRLPVPGRPIQYRTTQAFLRSFSLSRLDDLPELPNVSAEEERTGRALEERLAQLREEEAVEP